MTESRTYVCLPGAWMGAWTWKFVAERLAAAGHDVRALPFRGVGERAAELSPGIDNDVLLADTIDYLEVEDLRDVVLVGHSFGSLIIDDPDLAAWTHRQLTPHPVACSTKPIRLFHPAGNGRPMTYIACTRPRYPVSAGMHEKVQTMPHIRFRPIEAGHNCILSAPDLVAKELLGVPS